MHIKVTIVAYVFSVQCFENATIVAYAGLRVNSLKLSGTNKPWPKVSGFSVISSPQQHKPQNSTHSVMSFSVSAHVLK